MREIQASQAKTHLLQLLDDVEHGETIVITRHGHAIARLVPEDIRRRAAIGEAIEAIQKMRARNSNVTVQELLAWRHEGHR